MDSKKTPFLGMRADARQTRTRTVILCAWILGAVVLAAMTLALRGCLRRPAQATPDTVQPPTPPRRIEYAVRPAPASFPAGSHMPTGRESEVSGPVNLDAFSAGRDLIYLDDPRVWWESDTDTNDVECDHSIHIAMEAPLRRLIELVTERGGKLEVHETFRATAGIHSGRSLHQEGRALDVTCDQMPIAELAKLCWMAGFDWVYSEKGRGGNGPHVHCSMRKELPAP